MNKLANLIYLIIAVFSAMINWYCYKDVFLAILSAIFWPIHLIYCLFTGVFVDGNLINIINYYF